VSRQSPRFPGREPGQHRDELIPADAGQPAGTFRRQRGDAAGEDGQHRIPRGMAMAVVDGLEVVDVEQDQRRASGDRLPTLRFHAGAVPGAGHGVTEGGFPQHPLRPLPRHGEQAEIQDRQQQLVRHHRHHGGDVERVGPLQLGHHHGRIARQVAEQRQGRDAAATRRGAGAIQQHGRPEHRHPQREPQRAAEAGCDGRGQSRLREPDGRGIAQPGHQHDGQHPGTEGRTVLEEADAGQQQHVAGGHADKGERSRKRLRPARKHLEHQKHKGIDQQAAAPEQQVPLVPPPAPQRHECCEEGDAQQQAAQAQRADIGRLEHGLHAGPVRLDEEPSGP
jgi:hypothetical protein